MTSSFISLWEVGKSIYTIIILRSENTVTDDIFGVGSCYLSLDFPIVSKKTAISIMLSSALAVLALAASAQAASQIGSISPNTGKKSISRPNVQPYPYNTGRAAVVSPERVTECFVVPTGGDDSEAFLAALQECNNGGKVVLDSNYTIGSVLDLTFLDSIDIAISGKVTFTDDIDYWVDNYWKYDFQNSTSFFKLG